MPRGVYKRDMSPEACARRSATRKEVQNRPEVKKKHKEAMNCSEVKEKLRVAREGKSYVELFGEVRAEEIRKKQSESHTGKHRSEEAKANMRHPKSEEAKANMKGHCGVYEHKLNSKEQNAKIREATRRNWQDPEFAKMMIEAQHRKPNKAEKKLDKFLQEIFLKEYQINVNAEVMTLVGKCPDFVNVNGQKKLIEMNGDWWHGPGITGRTKEEEEKQRIDLFAKEGYQTLIVWEHELEDTKILRNRIIKFNEE